MEVGGEKAKTLEVGGLRSEAKAKTEVNVGEEVRSSEFGVRSEKAEKESGARNKNGERDYSVKALESGIRVMIGLGLPEYVELPLKDLAESLSLSANKTFRILQTLKRHQWVEEVEGRWRIAPAFTLFSDGCRKYLGKKIGEIERLKLEHLGA